MNILVVDNYDSFTYNLVQLVRKIIGKEPVVKRNDQLTLEEVGQFDKILLSPGPGLPVEAGLLLAIINKYAATKSILGVCLGHQAIAQVFGASLIKLDKVYHGVVTPVSLCMADSLFQDIISPFTAGRYHSWVVSKEQFPDELQVLSEDDEGHIMAIRHREYDVLGIQFHPESIMTPCGEQIMYNWINNGSCNRL